MLVLIQMNGKSLGIPILYAYQLIDTMGSRREIYSRMSLDMAYRPLLMASSKERYWVYGYDLARVPIVY